MIKRFYLTTIFMFSSLFLLSCGGLDGDNSDYDFGNGENIDNPYINGYDRLPNSIRLATYNTHRCEGNITQSSSVDRSHYAKTAEVISRIQPDVIALQELDSITTWHPAFQIQELATRTGLHYTYNHTIDYRGGKYGNGILSKEKPVKVTHVDLVGEEHRKMCVAEFSDYIFIATHFCHKNDENRKASAVIVNNFIKDNYSSYKKPIYLAGDLNESSLSSGMFQELLSKWNIISTSNVTFIGAGSTAKRIDFILVYKGNNASYEVLGTATPQYAGLDMNFISDHLPVLTDIKK